MQVSTLLLDAEAAAAAGAESAPHRARTEEPARRHGLAHLLG